MLILDELNFTKEMIKNKDYGKNYVSLKTLVLLAKYYYWEGQSTREVKKLLKEICKKTDRNYNETTQGWKFNIAIREAKKRKIRESIPIPITDAELEKIKSVGNYALERVLFILLFYSKVLKYNDTRIKPLRRPRLLGLFYVNERPNTIFSVAKVEIRKKQRNEALHFLYEKGFLDATKYNGFILKYVVEDSPTAFVIEDYESAILYYQRWKGEQVVGCECGKLFLKKSPKQIYCHKCKQEHRRETWRESRRKKKEEKARATLQF